MDELDPVRLTDASLICSDGSEIEELELLVADPEIELDEAVTDRLLLDLVCETELELRLDFVTLAETELDDSELRELFVTLILTDTELELRLLFVMLTDCEEEDSELRLDFVMLTLTLCELDDCEDFVSLFEKLFDSLEDDFVTD